jgi:exodeoxyribonuclease VII large subunit
MEQQLLNWEPEGRVVTVSELSSGIRLLLNGEFGDVWVSGEVSGLKFASSGHAYFSLKDSGAQIKCACFRGSLRLLKVPPQEGMAVLARGRVDVYEPRGEYQLIVEVIEPQGFGALQAAFEKLKKKLAEEGLFDAARKRPLPTFPRNIGIVTSPTGAAIRDLLQVLERRFPGLHIRLYPAQVQGAGSVEAVVEGIEYFGKSNWADVVIVGRGGGSLEDLWTFNEEAVVRAIAASPVPIVSAVGHETDFTIADFAADLRAPTPSAAAELTVRKKENLLDALTAVEQRLGRGLHFRVVRTAQRLDDAGYRAKEGVSRSIRDRRAQWQALDARLRKQDPKVALVTAHRSLDELVERLGRSAAQHLNARKELLERATLRIGDVTARRLLARQTKLERLRAELQQLSPLRVLERGYAIVQNEAGTAVQSVDDAKVGEALRIRLARGRLGARVTSKASE